MPGHTVLSGVMLIACILGASREMMGQDVGRSCTPTAADRRYSQRDAERYIERSEAEWAASVATNDASVLRRILGDNFVWVLDARILGKATAIQEATEGPGPFLSNQLDYVHIRFFGPVAVAQGSEHWTKSRGDMRAGRFIWTDTWVRCRGVWKIVSSQDISAAPLPPTRR
jgi:hypothetical protein